MEPLLGEIRIFAGSFAPQGWALCDGQVLDIQENVALFSIIGTTYGGNGTTTFALPDLRNRVPLHAGERVPGESGALAGADDGAGQGYLCVNYMIATTGAFPMRP
jgi:microcystin-dependent protein